MDHKKAISLLDEAIRFIDNWSCSISNSAYASDEIKLEDDNPTAEKQNNPDDTTNTNYFVFFHIECVY